MKDIIINKFISINDKTNEYVKLMNNYSDIVENFNLYYTNQMDVKSCELKNFKQEIKQQQQEQPKIMNKILFLNKYTIKLKCNLKEYQNFKKM